MEDILVRIKGLAELMESLSKACLPHQREMFSYLAGETKAVAEELENLEN